MVVDLVDSDKRLLLHTREVVCRGYERDDGLLDIEGRLRDISALAGELPFYLLDAGAAVHDMRLVMTIDTQMLIHRFWVSTDTGATPYCTEINRAYAALEGLRIGPGFKAQVRERLGGVRGCTHLTETVSTMASTAVQTILAAGRARRQRLGEVTGQPTEVTRKWVLNSCYVYRDDGTAVDRSLPRVRREAAGD